MSTRTIIKWVDRCEFGYAESGVNWTYELRKDGTADLFLGGRLEVSPLLLKHCASLGEAKLVAQLLQDILYGDAFTDIISRQAAFDALDAAWENFTSHESDSFDWSEILKTVPAVAETSKEKVS